MYLMILLGVYGYLRMLLVKTLFLSIKGVGENKEGEDAFEHTHYTRVGLCIETILLSLYFYFQNRD